MPLLKRLISSKNWKSAAAELALIVIGVSIALWADAWVNERQDLSRETARLSAVLADTEETEAAISALRVEVAEAASALRSILSLQPPYEPHNETLKLLRHGLLFGMAFHPEMSVYDDLKNSGELALLTNSEIRQSLSRMEAGLEQLKLTQADLTTVQQLNVDSYMVDHIDLFSFYGELVGLDVTEVSAVTDVAFISDRNFRNRILLKLDLVTQLELVLADTELRVKDAKQRIQSELDD